MAVTDYQLIEAWKQVLTLSNVTPGYKITVLTGSSSNAQTVSTAITAAQMMGAVVSRLDLPPVNGEKSLSRDSLAYLGTTPLTGNEPAIAALKASDLVLDLMTLLFSPEQLDILKSGTKILLAVEPPEVLCRLVPTMEDRARVLAAQKRIAGANKIRAISPGGTDVVYELGDFEPIAEYGFVDERGRWDHWPSGFVLTFPNEGGTNGRIVIDKGDIVLPQKIYLNEPITLTIEKGYCVKIEGSVEAELLKEYMATFNDPEAYAHSHVGWGLQPRAKWSTLGLLDREASIGMDARAYEGNFLISMGPNNEAGGSRTTACHIDIPLRGCTVYLDDEKVVDSGRVL